MNITRKGFVGALTGGTVLLLLKGCGGGGSDGAYGGGTVLVCGASGIAIAGNHGHVLAIRRAELDSLTDKSYTITGSSDHAHTVVFTPLQLQQLKLGAVVQVTSTSGASAAYPAHMHAVTAAVVAGCP